MVLVVLKIPAFRTFAQENPDIPVLGISVDGRMKDVKKYAKQLGIDYTVLVGDSKIQNLYNISSTNDYNYRCKWKSKKSPCRNDVSNTTRVGHFLKSKFFISYSTCVSENNKKTTKRGKMLIFIFFCHVPVN